ncbi:MAG: glycosyltransferase [Planctomycetes bacterium]|nr:glycosyltransferase [Planctomycetota bacterium]
MARLLVLSCGVGAGHNRAAEAVDAAARTAGFESRWLDSLSFTGRVFKTLYAQSYVWMASAAPDLWGLLYRRMGRRAGRSPLDKLVQTYDRLSYRKLMNEVTAFRPDAVVCTHFLPANVVLAHVGDAAPPVFTVVTDYDVHRLWINAGVEGYFAGNDEVRWLLRGFGVPEDRAWVTGIPIHPAFKIRRGRAAVRQELGIGMDERVVLFMSGGFGIGDVAPAVERLLGIDTDFHLLAIMGKNEKLKARVERVVRNAKRRAKVFGFVTNVPDLMEAADLMVSKAGGLTTSECLARGLPLVAFAPVPGQEERNADYLIEHGAAIKAPTVELVDFKVQEVLADPARLARMRRAAESLGRPAAAADIIRRLASFLVLDRLSGDQLPRIS